MADFVDFLIDKLSQIIIEPMNSRDAPSVAQIEKERFSVPWSEEAIRSELSNETARFFVAKRFGEVVGYIGVRIVLDECYISNLAVVEKECRKGVASKLLSVAEDFAKKSGAAFISLEVRKSGSGAIALYKKRGFETRGERKKFYSLPTEDALIMTKYFNKESNDENPRD